MSRGIAWCFVVGFGLELGACIAQCLWPETEPQAQPLACIGAGMMAFAVFAPERKKKQS